jgi:lactobin A/cerein 7B family class IIb bacteriocin
MTNLNEGEMVNVEGGIGPAVVVIVLLICADVVCCSGGQPEKKP